MATAWSEIITDNAMVVIDDIRLTEEMEINPAQFFRRMAMYFSMALPLVSRPPELYQYLTNGLVNATYDDTEWTSTEESLTQETKLETGMIGYDICSCVLRTISAGEVILTPYVVAYDAESGTVTFPQQTESGLEYVIDFYKDGQFANELTATQKRIIGLAIAIVWDERFTRNWLNIQPKIKDSSFNTVNEANYQEKSTERMKANRSAFNDELRKYEQDTVYRNVVSQNSRVRRFV